MVCVRAPQDPIPISPIAVSLLSSRTLPGSDIDEFRQISVTATILVATISTVVWGLVWTHNRQRDKRRHEREVYYREQMTSVLHLLSSIRRARGLMGV